MSGQARDEEGLVSLCPGKLAGDCLSIYRVMYQFLSNSTKIGRGSTAES